MNNICIYYIEYPKPSDVNKGLIEGVSMTAKLQSIGAHCVYKLVQNNVEFENALKKAGNVLTAYDTCFIHISSHGSPEGVGISKDDIISWERLTEVMKSIDLEVRSKCCLCLSTCYGASAMNIGKNRWLPYYNYIVGPVREIGWSESAMAFSLLYHLLIVENATLQAAIKTLNTMLREYGYEMPMFTYSSAAFQNTMTHIANPLKNASYETLYEYIKELYLKIQDK